MSLWLVKNLNLQEFLIKFQKTDVVNSNKDIFLHFKEKVCFCCLIVYFEYKFFQ